MLPTNYDRKPSIRYKVHREGVCSPETQQQRGKRNIAFRDTVPALSVYFKRSFDGILYKTNRYFAKVSKNHLSFPTRKENP